MRRWLSLLLLATACGGVAPRPEEIAAREQAGAADATARAAAAERVAEAWGHLERREWSQARRAAEAALALDPQEARAHAALGRCLMEEARSESPPALAPWRRAEGELRLAQRLAPQDPEIALQLAMLLEADGHFTAATAVLDEQLSAQPRHPGCLRAASRIHYEVGEERAALPLLVRLVALDPADGEALYRLAHCELRLARTALLEQGAAADGEVLASLERAVSAFAAYRQVFPADAEGFGGEAYARLLAVRAGPQPAVAAELDKLVELLVEASRLAPGSPEPEFNLGVVHELRGDADAARRSYEGALRREPEHLPSLLNLAAVHAAAGRGEAARAYCSRALALSPPAADRRRIEGFLAR